MRLALPLLAASSLVLLGQKPTLTDIDQAQKKMAADQAAAAAAQTDAINKNSIQNALERYKAQERADTAKKTEAGRFTLLEDGLRQVRDDRAREVKEAKESRDRAEEKAAADHEDLMRVIRNSSIGVIATVLASLIIYLLKALNDKRRHNTQEATLDHVSSTVDTIHTLTNSTLTEMTNKLQLALEKIAGLEKQIALLSEISKR